MIERNTAVRNEIAGADLSHTDRLADAQEQVERLINNVASVIYIDRSKLEYILAAKIAAGHVILADSHGVGKTSLAKAIAGSIRWRESAGSDGGASVAMEDFSRIQCTVDLLPQDILGFSRFDAAGHNLHFNKGPIFAHFVLCDEINLLTPKTQGSFFQAMEEQAVSIEGKTYPLSEPFFIIATMNLRGAHLFPLPAPQLDRFMVRTSIGYPDESDESKIVRQHGQEDSWGHFRPVIDSSQLTMWQRLVDTITITDEVIAYIVSVVRHTRNHPAVETGASPRAGIKLSRMARALALIRGDNFVSVDLVKELIAPTLSHRLIMQDPATPPEGVLEEVTKSVRVDGRRLQGI